jgi:hypothetical protein
MLDPLSATESGYAREGEEVIGRNQVRPIEEGREAL